MAKVTLTIETSTRKIGHATKRIVEKIAAGIEKAAKEHPEMRDALILLFGSFSDHVHVHTREDYERERAAAGADEDKDEPESSSADSAESSSAGT